MESSENQADRPRWPKLEEIDPTATVFDYDRTSDTLLVHFFGRGEPAISVPIDGQEIESVFLLVHPMTDRVVGLHLEDFLSRCVPERPEYLDALDVADLRGITRDEVAALRHRIAPDARKRATVRTLFGTLAALGA